MRGHWLFHLLYPNEISDMAAVLDTVCFFPYCSKTNWPMNCAFINIPRFSETISILLFASFSLFSIFPLIRFLSCCVCFLADVASLDVIFPAELQNLSLQCKYPYDPQAFFVSMRIGWRHGWQPLHGDMQTVDFFRVPKRWNSRITVVCLYSAQRYLSRCCYFCHFSFN